MSGRFAPSPTGDLHLGNLRTALVAWLSARSQGLGFRIRVEDLDRVASSVEIESRQLADLERLGLDHDGEIVRQSDRFDRYNAALDRLRAAGLVYECFCTRREIAAEIAASTAAPHQSEVAAHVGMPRRADGAYPGTCRELTTQRRERLRAEGRRPALRLRADRITVEASDEVLGTMRGLVDDLVVQRGDGVPAYNLAVVVDDAAQGIVEVVRADDLWSSTPRQVHLQRLLGLPTPRYRHVPLVLGPDGTRLAKRHGAVSLADLATRGITADSVLRELARSLDLPGANEARTAADLLDALDERPLAASALSGDPWQIQFAGGDPTMLAGDR